MDDARLTAATPPGSPEERAWTTTADFLDSLPPALKDATLRAAIVHWFDADVLRALLEEGADPPADELYRSLRTFPFVEEYVRRGHNVHSLVRGAILGELWRSRRDFYRDVSALAVAHFQRPFVETGEGDVTDLIESAYHLVVVDEAEGIALAAELFDALLASAAFDSANGLVETLQEQLDGERASPELDWRLVAWRARIAAGTGIHEEAVRLATEVESIDDAPALLRGGMALVAGTSLAELGRLEQAEGWLRRAREHEQPNAIEAAENLVALARLFHVRNDFAAAELAYMDALDAYVPHLLPALKLVEPEEGEEESGEAVTAWTTVDDEEDESSDVILPPRPLARFPESWVVTQDEDAHFYLVAVNDDVTEVTQGEGPPAWPVMVDGFLGMLWIRLGYLYADLDDAHQAAACAQLGGSIATDVGNETLIADAHQLLYRLGTRDGRR